MHFVQHPVQHILTYRFRDGRVDLHDQQGLHVIASVSHHPILRRVASNALTLRYGRFDGLPRQDRPITPRESKGDGGQPNSTTGQGSKSMAPWKTMPSQ
jgi:hypothetical protein